MKQRVVPSLLLAGSDRLGQSLQFFCKKKRRQKAADEAILEAVLEACENHPGLKLQKQD